MLVTLLLCSAPFHHEIGLWGLFALFRLIYMHLMWKRLGKKPFINAEVTASVILIFSGCFPRQIWWWWHFGSKKEIGCLWSPTYLPKDKPCLLPWVRVSVRVANSDLHGTCYGELPFIPQAFLLLFTFLGLAHLLKYDLLGLWASSLNQVQTPPPQHLLMWKDCVE